MNTAQEFPAAAPYIGATADELSRMTTADKVAGGVSQKALFQRRGTLTLDERGLVLGGWGDGGDLVLGHGDVTDVRVEFTDLYGRFIGGLLNAGKPLILTVAGVGEIYLLVDRKEFMETTDDRAWAERIRAWRATAG
ncbi:hypothetical protein [Streptomyces sp. VRA16 Mangrove soil]|uniref:hypothetical protein n=1 Tax=Streptomyces sp. VRA16 Mangrove soil TaxID=2817434 RepID=UPI001A9E296F|nr:hypothetical protein [Streptomyces sp. VRA16 Mangrove soil]MBO1331528.1 hypothetical protein [Streptomyces sp. VRA16 Mangrove soil]